MKECAQQYLSALTYIINYSILEGYFPEGLKLAKVLLSFKCKDENKMKIIGKFVLFHFISNVFEEKYY